MRVSELSDRSGVAVATIKFYSREGVLPAGQRTGPTQTEYSDVHLDRLRLIRALLEAGGLSIAAAKRVIAAIDDREMPLDYAFGIAQGAIPAGPHVLPDVEPEAGSGAEHVAALIMERGWRVFPENPGIALAARTIDAYRSVGRADLLRSLPAYADAAELIAAADLDAVAAAPDRDRMTETVVIGTVLGDAMIAGLRRIAQEHRSHQEFPVRGRHPDDQPSGGRNPGPDSGPAPDPGSGPGSDSGSSTDSDCAIPQPPARPEENPS